MSPITAAYIEHRAALRRWIARFTRGCDVDDIAQEAFLRAYKVELGRPIEQPKSFLFRIAKHLALNWIKISRRVSPGELPEITDFGPEDEALAQETWSRHLTAIRRLPDGCRQVYWLRIHGDLSHKEISSRLGIAVSTVEKHCIQANNLMTAA